MATSSLPLRENLLNSYTYSSLTAIIDVFIIDRKFTLSACLSLTQLISTSKVSPLFIVYSSSPKLSRNSLAEAKQRIRTTIGSINIFIIIKYEINTKLSGQDTSLPGKGAEPFSRVVRETHGKSYSSSHPLQKNQHNNNHQQHNGQSSGQLGLGGQQKWIAVNRQRQLLVQLRPFKRILSSSSHSITLRNAFM